MPYLRFELKESEERKEEYRGFLQQYSDFCKCCADMLLCAMELLKPKDDKYHHGVVFLLARHVAEEIDAISVLAAAGCADPCKAHLRSAFEAELQMLYILEKESENRAIAYHLAEHHKQLKDLKKIDPNEDSGKRLRDELKNDPGPLGILEDIPTKVCQKQAEQIIGILHKPPFIEIDEEWQKSKKKYPAWYSLFSGPNNIHDLAYHLGKAFWYEFPYSDFSGQIHAGNSVKNVARNRKDPTGENQALRPLRRPYGLQTVCQYALGVSIETEQILASKYLNQQQKDILFFQLREYLELYN